MATSNPVADTPHLEAEDSEALENDSAFGDNASNASERTSLFSEIMKYREENGRRYHGYKDGTYLLPNDEKEQDRLDLHHHIFTMVDEGKLYRAPIESPSRVLDIGTGTGIWAIDFADLHPEAHVIGTDLSPIQPQWVPPNIEFIVDDAEDEWIGAKYDYIHIRSLSGAIKDWPSLLARCYSNLNPGGWLEITEFEVWVHSYNNKMDAAPDITTWQNGLSEAAEKIGRRFDVAVNLEKWLKAANFGDVVQHVSTVPTQQWPKNRRMKMIGAYQQQNMLDATSSYGQAHFTRVLGWSAEEYAVLGAKVRGQLKDSKLQLYSNLYTVYGRKPLGTAP